MEFVSGLELLIISHFLSKSLFPMLVTVVAMLVKRKRWKKAIFTVLCWFLKARFVELSDMHLAATGHAHSLPPPPLLYEFYSHCNCWGKLLKKVFLWLNNASLFLLRRNLHGTFNLLYRRAVQTKISTTQHTQLSCALVCKPLLSFKILYKTLQR